MVTISPNAPLPPATPAPDMGSSVSRGFWAEAWRRFRRRKLAMLALCYVVFLMLVAIFSGMIVGTKPIVVRYKGEYYFPFTSYYYGGENAIFLKDKFRQRYPTALKRKDPDHWAVWPLVFQDPYRRVMANEWIYDAPRVVPDDAPGADPGSTKTLKGQPANPTGDKGKPSQYNLFGTTPEGLDIFAVLVHGTRTALLVGFVSMGVAATIGVLIGALAGYFGGWVDMLFSRFIELVMSIPTLILILAVLALLETTTIWHLMAVIGMTGWTTIARLTRAEFMKLRQAEFVIAAEAIGVTWPRIILRYVLPNALAPVMVPITFGIAGAILIESALSFLGFGAPPPTPSWGVMLNAARANLNMWWLIVFPGLSIFSAVLAYNLIGEGLQEATDPRLREASK